MEDCHVIGNEESEVGGEPPRKKRFSAVYKHFEEIEGSPMKLKCNYCHAILGMNTSSLSRHLARNHKEQYQDFLIDEKTRLTMKQKKIPKPNDEATPAKKPSKKRNRVRVSNVYNYFVVESSRAHCNFCSKCFVVNTTTLMRHLCRAHPEQYELLQMTGGRSSEIEASMVSDDEDFSITEQGAGPTALFESIVNSMRQQLSRNQLKPREDLMDVVESLSQSPSPQKILKKKNSDNPFAEVLVDSLDPDEDIDHETHQTSPDISSKINQEQFFQLKSQIYALQQSQKNFQNEVNRKLDHLGNLVQMLVRSNCSEAVVPTQCQGKVVKGVRDAIKRAPRGINVSENQSIQTKTAVGPVIKQECEVYVSGSEYDEEYVE